VSSIPVIVTTSMRIAGSSLFVATLAVAATAHAGETAKIRATGERATLEVEDDPMSDWRPLCTTPCVVDAPRYATFRVTNEYRIRSADFYLRSANVAMTIRSSEGSADGRDKGARIAYGAAALMIVGGITELVGLYAELATSCPFVDPYPCVRANHTAADWAVAMGGGALLVGSVLLIVGLVYRHVNGRRIDVDVRSAIAPKTFATEKTASLWSPPMAAFPLLRVSF